MSAKIRLTRRSAAYWKVTFDNPPLNIVGPVEVRDLAGILDELEADPKVKVVVFDSAVPDYFMAHYDLLKPLEDSTGMPPGPTGMHPVPDFMVRLSRLEAVTIVSIRGRASGIGSELALAADMRFASREKAVISQFEVGAGFVPGGGPMARLPRLVGRGRALEILIGADDFDGELAERYGYVNRALPDAELDGFVDALATRIASFDRQAIADTKKLVDVASMPPDAEMQPGWDAFITSVQRPAAQARVKALIGKGLGQPGDIERRLGQYTARYEE
jgi:enoyl-CoA hydratase/carnithine racemase